MISMEEMLHQEIVLEGKVVRLEPLSFNHVAGLAEAGKDPLIWRYMLYGDVVSVEGIRRWVDDLLNRKKAGTDYPFAVIDKNSGQVAGATRFMDMRPAHRGLEIGGTWYGNDFQRTAVNTETKFLLLQYAFEMLGCIRVQFKADSRNEKSLKAIERIGGKREGVLRNHMILETGLFRHSVYFSILEDEWPDVKDNLIKKLNK